VTALLLVLGLVLAGAAGSVLRHEVLRWAGEAGTVDRARGVAIVNLVGAAVAAAALVGPWSSVWVAVVALGFAGSLTTFSTWTVEVVLAREAGRSWVSVAALDLVGQLLVGVGLVLLVSSLAPETVGLTLG
jgi:fluoride exporter